MNLYQEGQLVTDAAFKAYDIRGKVPEELNEEIAYRVGRAFVAHFGAKTVVVGRDMRLTGPAFFAAVAKGVTDAGADVIDIGMVGTEMVYFGTSYFHADGGIMITASHNPAEYNGLKIVKQDSRPVSGDTGLKELAQLVLKGEFGPTAANKGQIRQGSMMDDYIKHLLTYIDPSKIKPFTIVTNSGNGCAGMALDELLPHLPVHAIRINDEPDGTFPNGVPNPLLIENRDMTAKVVREEKADIGFAWDGDFDRCFFFDDQGNFIEGYYIIGLLAEQFLQRYPGAKILHDVRLAWNSAEVIAEAGGIPLAAVSGHAFMKERLRAEDAVYGGEMSAHHYFKDFFYCDSGMIPWLVVLKAMSDSGKSLAELVGERMKRYPASGEINSTVKDAPAKIAELEARYAPAAVKVDHLDGLSVEYDKWRFNLRMSNTEPLLRLNVESRGDAALMKEKTEELLALIRA